MGFFDGILGGGGGMLGGLGSGLSLLGGMFGNPADSAMPYFNKIPGEMKPYYDPFINAGTGAIPDLQGRYKNMLNDPGQFINGIGQGYQQSSGFQAALQQALQGANHAAAAGGMAGSPEHEQENMGIATNLANQDYNQWLQHALGAYNRGLGGEENLFNTGYGASNELAQSLGNNLMSQGSLAFQGKANQQKMISDILGAMAKAGGMGGF